jgi:peptidoglycan/LPS O-acetylase OafA/YrhL
MKNSTDKVLYLPGLNGIRAIASIAVVFSHITLALPVDFHLKGNFFGVSNNGSAKGYLLASYGVSMFFVLSGFLITYLLKLEADKNEIDIKKFYIRRILRIWPLYYLYLIMCIATILCFQIPVNFTEIWFYIFFAANVPAIYDLSLPLLTHFWSIGVEEQFYLFWPWIIKKVKANVIPLLIGLIVLQNIIRVVLWYYYPFSHIANFSMICRFDCMMIGAAEALLYKQHHQLFLRLIDHKWTQAFALFILGLLIVNKFHINAIVDNFTIAIVTLIIIIGQINKKNRLISFDNPVFDFLGKISFGVYVYHPLLIFYVAKLYANVHGESIGKFILVYTSVLLGTIVLSYFSYTYFESWFIKLKSKFAVVKSAGSRTTPH